MTDPAAQTQWTAAELRERLERGERFFIFDVRNEDEFESWKIEGRKRIPMVNVPYYEMLEVDEHDDVVDSFKDFLRRGWLDRLPEHEPVLAVCAKGDTSEFVAQAMRGLGLDAYNLEGGTKAWGDHYYSRAVSESDEVAVYQVARPARGCLSYILASRGEAAVIDPLRHIAQYMELAESKGWRVKAVLDTHAHADHISGGPALARATGAPYYLHPYDGIHPIDVVPATIDFEFLVDGQTIDVGGIELRTLHIPGHTLGNSAFLTAERFLLTGDSIFIESIARPDLGGRGDTWAPMHYGSLRRLMELPDDVLVLPAHFSTLAEADDRGLYAGSLGELKRRNEGLLMAQQSEPEFVEYILGNLPEFPDEYVEIKRVNAGLKQVGESKASELELGKNICALAQADAAGEGE